MKAAALALLFLGTVGSLAAAETLLVGRVVTIQNVELRNAAGEWLSVIRPDKEVDLLSEEPVVSFFNNHGRVPEGLYDDFRVTLLVNDTKAIGSLSPESSLAAPLRVRKGSFIRVAFRLKPEPDARSARAEKAAITVDGQTLELEELRWS